MNSLKNLYNTVIKIPSLAALPASELYRLVAQLQEIEDGLGGPYATKLLPNRQALRFNSRIYRLFAQQGKELPAVKSYVLTSDESRGLLQPHPLPQQLLQPRSPLRSGSHAHQHVPLPFQLPPLHAAVQNSCHQQAYRSTAHFPKSIQIPLKKTLRTITKVDESGEITLLAKLFAEELASSCKYKLATNPNQAVQLGTANMLVWAAYTLFDTLADAAPVPPPGVATTQNTAQQAVPLWLVASIALRHAHSLYSVALPPVPHLIDTLFDETDTAIATELTTRNCLTHTGTFVMVSEALSAYHQGNTFYDLLASKSIAHLCGPLIVLAQLPQCVISKTQQNACKTALRLYCAARQLNDDLHDWAEDFRAGHPTYVIACLIQDAHITPGTYPVESLFQQLQVTFWNTTLSTLLQQQLAMIESAYSSIASSGLMRPNCAFLKMTLEPLKDSAQNANKRHEFDKNFVAALTKSSST